LSVNRNQSIILFPIAERDGWRGRRESTVAATLFESDLPDSLYIKLVLDVTFVGDRRLVGES